LQPTIKKKRNITITYLKKEKKKKKKKTKIENIPSSEDNVYRVWQIPTPSVLAFLEVWGID
jgi:hypothetical protein